MRARYSARARAATLRALAGAGGSHYPEVVIPEQSQAVANHAILAAPQELETPRASSSATGLNTGSAAAADPAGLADARRRRRCGCGCRC